MGVDAWERYRNFLHQHEKAAFALILQKERWDHLETAGPHFLQATTLEAAIEKAILEQYMSVLRTLLQYKHAHIGFGLDAAFTLTKPADGHND